MDADRTEVLLAANEARSGRTQPRLEPIFVLVVLLAAFAFFIAIMFVHSDTPVGAAANQLTHGQTAWVAMAALSRRTVRRSNTCLTQIKSLTGVTATCNWHP